MYRFSKVRISPGGMVSVKCSCSGHPWGGGGGGRIIN